MTERGWRRSYGSKAHDLDDPDLSKISVSPEGKDSLYLRAYLFSVCSGSHTKVRRVKRRLVSLQEDLASSSFCRRRL